MDLMTMEQYAEEAPAQYEYDAEDKHSLDKWNSIAGSDIDPDDGSCNEFDCNICLDSVQDPVVTLCGHLYCWPCIYKWLHFRTLSLEHQQQQPQQHCPVCKSHVSQDTLVPLFGREKPTKPSKTKAPNLGIIIPRRPLGLACGFDSPRSPNPTATTHQNHQTYPQRHAYPSHLYHSPRNHHSNSPMLSPGSAATSMFDPVLAMFGEMMFARVFGSSVTNMYAYPDSYYLTGNASPRLRRHVMQADKSLSRIYFFLFCCAFLCFLLF